MARLEFPFLQDAHLSTLPFGGISPDVMIPFLLGGVAAVGVLGVIAFCLIRRDKKIEERLQAAEDMQGGLRPVQQVSTVSIELPVLIPGQPSPRLHRLPQGPTVV